MNLDEILSLVQDFRSQLEVWGVTNGALWIAAAIAGVLFIFSLREVAMWFLRTQQIRDEVRGLRKEIGHLQKSVNQLQELMAASGQIESTKPLNAEELLSVANRFRLDH